MLKKSTLKSKKQNSLKHTPLKKSNGLLKSNCQLKSNNSLKATFTGCNKLHTIKVQLKKQSDKSKEQWDSVRQEIIKRDNGKCQLCGKPGSHVHHILLRSKKKALLYSKNNLILLCSKCHNHSSTDGYMELSQRIARKKGITVEELFKQAEKED